jgi:hypothetical protein
VRTLEELIDSTDPGWPLVEEWLRDAKNPVEVLPRDEARAAEVLTFAQVTTRSPLGAIIYHSGGLVVDGWVRILGGGGPRMRGDFKNWNGGGELPIFGGVPGAIVVALDILGGVFAMPATTRQVSYFAPDSLRWEELERGYSDFIYLALNVDLDEFSGGLRWNGWREETKALSLDHGIHVMPPLWTRESKTGPVSRRDVPLHEIVKHAFHFQQQLDAKS